MQTTVTFTDNNCTETDDFVDSTGAVVLSNTREEADDYCCQAYTSNGDDDLLDACVMTETFSYPQADGCTSLMKFVTSDGTIVSQDTESHANDVCCQEYEETADNAEALLNACVVTDEDFQYAEGACTSTFDYTTVAGEVMFTSFAEHQAAECCYWGQDQGLPVYTDADGSTEPLYTQCQWQEESFANGQCYRKMARDAHGDLFEDLIAYENPEDEPNCCALAIAANDDEMWTVCEGVDYRTEETMKFTTFTECEKITEIYLNDSDEVLASKSEPTDCPCQDEIPIVYEDTVGWEVAMWHHEQAKPHF